MFVSISGHTAESKDQLTKRERDNQTEQKREREMFEAINERKRYCKILNCSYLK